MIELQTMNEIPIYTIIKIEAEEAEIPMLTFYVKEDSMDESRRDFDGRINSL